MKASRTFKVDTRSMVVQLTVWGTCDYSHEPSSWDCPDVESFEMLTLDLCEVEIEIMPRHSRKDLCFELRDEAGILAYCKAWGVDPFAEMGPEDIEEKGPDGPDPDDLRDLLMERDHAERDT